MVKSPPIFAYAIKGTYYTKTELKNGVNLALLAMHMSMDMHAVLQLGFSIDKFHVSRVSDLSWALTYSYFSQKRFH